MKIAILLAVMVGGAVPCCAQVQDPLAQIQASHIEGNVPAAKKFDAFLNRDLRAYFKSRLKKTVSVKYEFLRNGATQSGVAFPKYYLWVTVTSDRKTVTQGAVRVAAIDKKRFEVTDFLSLAELRRDTGSIDSTFPIPVGAKIRERL